MEESVSRNGQRIWTIGEVSRELELEQYVLRYWETEFKQLRPRRNPAGQRLYGERDLQLLRQIADLLYERHYTIAGARRVLAGEAAGEALPATAPQSPPDGARLVLAQVVLELQAIRRQLAGGPGSEGA